MKEQLQIINYLLGYVPIVPYLNHDGLPKELLFSSI